MTKRPAANETTNMIQTALWLPRGMHEKLKKAGGARKLGDEIRRRLQNTFDTEQLPRDPTTNELLDAIKQIEGNLDEKWSTNHSDFEVFKTAINELLLNYQPKGEAPPGTDAKFKTKYGPEAKAETIGRILAYVAIKDIEKKRAKLSVVDKQKG